MAPAMAMQERGRETIFFSVVGREHTITERTWASFPMASKGVRKDRLQESSRKSAG
jgi:hypothetical protein